MTGGLFWRRCGRNGIVAFISGMLLIALASALCYTVISRKAAEKAP